MDGSPYTTNSRLLAARLSNALEARSAPSPNPRTRPLPPRDRRTRHTAIASKAQAAYRIEPKRIPPQPKREWQVAERRRFPLPSSESAAMLSTKTQLTHKPAQKGDRPRNQWARRHHMLALGRTHTQMQSLIWQVSSRRSRYTHQIVNRGKAPFCVRSSIIDVRSRGRCPKASAACRACRIDVYKSRGDTYARGCGSPTISTDFRKTFVAPYRRHVNFLTIGDLRRPIKPCNVRFGRQPSGSINRLRHPCPVFEAIYTG